MEITPVPSTPAYVRGVINLRGKIIPVIDLRRKFGMPPVPDTAETCIIVVEVDMDGLPSQVSVVVDSVSEVIDVYGDDIEPAPDLGISGTADFIQAIAKLSESIVILLDIDTVARSSAGLLDPPPSENRQPAGVCGV